MRETIVAKAHRYLTSARLTVEHVDPDRIEARCRGDNGLYQLGWTHPDGWHCSCPASRRCSHLIALRLVCIVDTHHLTPAIHPSHDRAAA